MLKANHASHGNSWGLCDMRWRRMIQVHGLLLEQANVRRINRLLNDPLGRGRSKGKVNRSPWHFLSPNCTSHNPNVVSAGVPVALVLGICVSAAWYLGRILMGWVTLWVNSGSLLFNSDCYPLRLLKSARNDTAFYDFCLSDSYLTFEGPSMKDKHLLAA